MANNSATKYHGAKGAFFSFATSGGAAALVANINDWKIDIQQDIAEVSCLGDTWKTFVVGLKGATGSLSGYWAADADIPFDAFDSGVGGNFYGYPAGSAVAQYVYGSIFPTKVGIDVPVSGPTAISADFTVNGVLSRNG
jgi:hypothetical protein